MRHEPPALLEMIRALIAQPSVSSHSPQFDQGNREVIDLLATWAEGLGFRVQVQPLPHHPRKANLVATLGEGPGGLVLAGHTDTVPYDAGKWRHDPFGGQIEDGKLYGLGSCDMKSFLALALEAAREVSARPDALRQPLILVATADEECTMAGARALVEAGLPRARHAILGEPTSLRPIRMHKGITMEMIRVLGRSGHSSDPSLGVSALDGMHRAMTGLLAWREQLALRHRDDAFAVPYPTLNLGRIEGGDNPNRICACCELQIDMRPLPGMSRAALRRELGEVMRASLGDERLSLEILTLFDGIEALDTPADAALVQAVEAFTGTKAGAVAFGTEGPFLQKLGMDTVVLGPGSIDQAHQPDEYIPLDHLPATVTLLRKSISRFCADPTAPL